MGKTGLIIKREYQTRVRKRSFLVMTILGPLLMALLFIAPLYIAQKTFEKKTVQVIDESGFYYNKLTGDEQVEFLFSNVDIAKAISDFPEKNYNAVLYIPDLSPSVPNVGILHYEQSPGLAVQAMIKAKMKQHLTEFELMANGLSKDLLKDNVKIVTKDIETGEKSYEDVSTAMGWLAGLLVYMFIFMYCVQVMRGVIEEKTNRIVEVMVSSVKPFQLMTGKIVGVALVGLTQFSLWIVLTMGIVTYAQSAYPQLFQLPQKGSFITDNQKLLNTESIQTYNEQNLSAEAGDEAMYYVQALHHYNYVHLVTVFIFYFLGGFLLYAALFAAVGSAVDSEADTQQFILPVTLPLILSLVLAQFVALNPDGQLAFWLSVIPFTSPISMMVRLPFGVPLTHVLLSGTLLILSFIATTKFAGRIYRTGILMYGKKAGYKEVFRWIKYKN